PRTPGGLWPARGRSLERIGQIGPRSGARRWFLQWQQDRVVLRSLQALAQVLDQPLAGAAGGTPALVDDVDRDGDGATVVLLELQALQPAGGDVRLHQMDGHVAPAEAGQE